MIEEKMFFNTFGYLEIPIDKTDIVEEFEKDISDILKLDYIGNELPRIGNKGRHQNIRNSTFNSEKIYSIFYNNKILDYLKSIIGDFVVLSTLESFYLQKSNIHRDFCGELKTVKLLFYLDDVSDIEKGPLYVIPGTQNVYDKYSCSLGNNVQWPPLYKNNVGGGYISHSDYFEKNVPKKYLFSNKDKILMFNTSILHGSQGNHVDHAILRRAIGITIIVVDKNNTRIMDSVNSFFYNFNVKPKDSLAFLYCDKNKDTCGDWLEHFHLVEKTSEFRESLDSTDHAAILESIKLNRFKSYTDSLENHYEDICSPYNCLKDQIKTYSI